MKIKAVKKKDKPTQKSDNISQWLFEYNGLREKSKIIKKRMNELSNSIKKYVTENGEEGSNGSYFSKTDKFVYGKQAKTSVKLNEEKAKSLMKKKGLYTKVIDIVEKVNEDKIEQLLQEGEISLDDIDNIVDTKISYAILVKDREDEEEEEVPEIQVSNIKK